MYKIDYPQDVKRVQDVLFKNGYVASLIECEQLWITHSDDYCAKWCSLEGESDKYIFKMLIDYIKIRV